MNVEEILKRLKELQDPFDYQPDIDALVHDIEESLKRYVIRKGCPGFYWAFSGWSRKKECARQFSKEDGKAMLDLRNVVEGPGCWMEEA